MHVLHSWQRAVVLAALAWALSCGRLPAETTLDVEVDARSLPRRLLHADIRIPCRPGKLTLWYPKWIPGTHSPDGPIANVGGLRLETPDGKPLAWRRDEIENCAVTCEVPAEAKLVLARLDYICNEPPWPNHGAWSYGSSAVGVINWNTCLLYPDGCSSEELRVRLRLRLPPKWRFATALKVDERKEGVITFRSETLSGLIDSPLIGGEHLRTVKLNTDGYPPAYLHLVSESLTALWLDSKVVDCYSRVVTEACRLFGTAHYDEYHFLVTCSNDLGCFGLEHHTSSLNGVYERDLIDDENRKGWNALLLPHEFVHSWCGKHRRPAGMCTLDFHTPQRTKLLWVYEGLAEYLSEVLAVRSGLVSQQEYREMLAWTISTQKHRTGRRWRSLEDTATAFWTASRNWSDLRRDSDFYFDGMLLWLEADAIIRDRSKGRRSLDDFCRQFLGAHPSKDRVVPYELPEIVKLLREQAYYDWERFVAQRVAAPQESLPLEVVSRCGYTLQYTSRRPAYVQYMESRGRKSSGFISARDSLGLAFSEGGLIMNVNPGGVGDKAGLAPGAQVVRINGKRFTRQDLYDALADSGWRGKIDLLVEENKHLRTIVLEYEDGIRYQELVRDNRKPDLLAEIMRPRAVKAANVASSQR